MDNEKKSPDNGREDVKKKPKSFLETVKEIDEREKKEELAREAKAAEEQARQDEIERREYARKLRQEKLELIKLKQGMISEEDIPKEEKPQKVYTIGERISNFFYHYKWHVIIGAMALGLVAFLVNDYISTERPDIQGMFIATDFEMSYYADEITSKWSGYAEDHNGDGKLLAKLYYIPTGYDDVNSATMYLAQSDRTKLLGEFQSGNTIIVIGDKSSYQSLGALENVFYDCRELFPGDPYAEELGYRLAGTDFKELIGRSDMDDSQLYVSFRRPVKTMGMSEEKMQVQFDHAVDFWRGFISEHRVDGVELEATVDPEPIADEYSEEYYGEASGS